MIEVSVLFVLLLILSVANAISYIIGKRFAGQRNPLKIKVSDKGKDIQQKIIFKENLIKYRC